MVESYPTTEMDVAFQLGRIHLERAHQGIDNVCNKGVVDWLFPDSLHLRPYRQVYQLNDGDFLNKKIVRNLEQRTAVEKILNCSSRGAPYIVFGPPGTGKTVTIVEAIYQLLRMTQKKILVCAPANAACDMLASKLIPYCERNQLIRVHSETRERSTITPQIQQYSNMTSKGEFLPIKGSDLNHYRIVVTTLIFIGKFSGFKPDAVFIDEAAQALEPDVCVPLGIIRPEASIVLAGDPKQLGPIVQSNVAREYGLGVSMLERLMDTQETYKNQDPNFITMLIKNFRSHPDILDLPNKLFYEEKLQAISQEPINDPISRTSVYPKISSLFPVVKVANGLNAAGHAVEFCAVSAKERREGRSPSYFNPAEADMALKYVITLVHLKFHPDFQVKPSDIGIITPYIRQVYKIKLLLQAHGLNDVEVGSTESFQGREKRIIIISTVRAQHDLLKHDEKYSLGFVKKEKRFNVAMTRAISKLIVIGCPAVLATDEKWRGYMQMCRNFGAYYGAPYEERTKEKKKQIVDRFDSFPKFSNVKAEQ
ncbi:hypothetical protein HHI36_017667 [Cryptolaemus montrouzieri]|uniref:Helicase ATP-binding domain-containing protein n=1 Tax=Cryptolaemus montrouzieri TaxID=559131 RepID=A0ABD2NP17_9CUCU